MEIAVVIILGLVIVALLVERFLTIKTLLKQVEDMKDSILFRNPIDYIAVKSQKERKVEEQKEDEHIPSENVSDEEFEAMISNLNKQ